MTSISKNYSRKPYKALPCLFKALVTSTSITVTGFFLVCLRVHLGQFSWRALQVASQIKSSTVPGRYRCDYSRVALVANWTCGTLYFLDILALIYGIFILKLFFNKIGHSEKNGSSSCCSWCWLRMRDFGRSLQPSWATHHPGLQTRVCSTPRRFRWPIASVLGWF